MKRVAFISVFVSLCLFLILITGRAYAQQGIPQVDLSKLSDPRLFPYTTIPNFPSYPTTSWPPSQPYPTFFTTIPSTTNLSPFFGNMWYLMQLNGYLSSWFLPSTRKNPPKPSRKDPNTLHITQLDTTLEFSIETGRSIYNKAELIPFTLKLKNTGYEDSVIECTSEQKIDVVIKDKQGGIVRQLSSDIQYAEPSTTLILQAEETETIYLKWNQEDEAGMIVPSGSYIIEASLNAVDEESAETLSATISIDALPRFSNCKKLKERLKVFYEKMKPEPEPSSSNGEDDGDGHPRGPVTFPWAYYGYGGMYGGIGGYGGMYGGVAGYGGTYGYAAGGFGGAAYTTQRGIGADFYYAPSYAAMGYAPSFAGGFAAYAPSYGTQAFAPSFVSGYASFAPSYGGYANLSSSFSTAYSSYAGAYNLRTIRWKAASEGDGGDKGSSGDGYSTTNVQVIGVDEADIVKNDGTYIYMIREDNSGEKTIKIIKASPADSMEVVNEIDLTNDYSDFEPSRLYVHENILVVIGEQSLPYDSFYDIQPDGTRIFIYDMTDITNESLQRKLIFWGEYLQSRMVGDTLYVLMNEAAPLELFAGALTDGSELLPRFYDYPSHGGNENNDERLCECDEVAYLTEHMSHDYLLVIGIPLDDPAKGIGSEVILGKCAHVYSTEENLYVTTRHNEDNDSTAVYKFWFDGETIVYGSNADVAGEVFNQFSMDESEDHLRIATTSDTELKQNIYIFDSGMKETGSLKDFTSGDNIRSIRFVDERCYVVIDRNILPLSVISLTDPKDPFILDTFDIFHGIEYIHPYDDNLILGFGRETVGTTEMGMKISLFDFSDMANPQQIVLDEIIGDGGTESEVFTDHRALLFSKEGNLMAFPVTVKEDDGMPQYTFQGAYIYQIDESGFDRRYEITHYPLGTFPISSDYASSGDHIRRIVSMGDYDYTISDSRITAILTSTDMFSLLLE